MAYRLDVYTKMMRVIREGPIIPTNSILAITTFDKHDPERRSKTKTFMDQGRKNFVCLRLLSKEQS